MYSFMMALPWEFSFRRRAPEQVELIFRSHERGDQFRAPRLERFSRRRQCVFTLFGKLGQRAQEHFRVLHVTHPALIIVHLLEIRFGIALQNRMHDLDHIPEFLERDAEPVNGCGPLRLNLPESLLCPRKSLVHR
jgi:hypothetical protein